VELVSYREKGERVGRGEGVKVNEKVNVKKNEGGPQIENGFFLEKKRGRGGGYAIPLYM